MYGKKRKGRGQGPERQHRDGDGIGKPANPGQAEDSCDDVFRGFAFFRKKGQQRGTTPFRLHFVFGIETSSRNLYCHPEVKAIEKIYLFR